jgi:hypothetical protein
MAVRAETIETVDEFCRVAGRNFEEYDVGRWLKDGVGRLTYAQKLPQKRGIYAHGFLVDDKLVPFYGGLTAAKAPNGLRTRMGQEYNKKMAAISPSGPYKACLFLEHYSLGNLPIRILFHDMSEKTDDEIKLAEAELLKTIDFCANTKDNGGLRLDDLVTRIKVLVTNAKPHMNTTEEPEVVEEVGTEEEEEVSPEEVEFDRALVGELQEHLSMKVFSKHQKRAIAQYNKLLISMLKEEVSDKAFKRCSMRAKALC